MTILSPTQKLDAQRVAGSTRLARDDVTKATPVRVLGDSRFGANDEPDKHPRIVGQSVYREIAEERQCANMEALGEWTSMLGDDREMSAYFGPISTRDLIAKILFNTRATAEQANAARLELRERLLTEYVTDIADDILRMQDDAERDEPYCGRERGEFDAQVRGVRNRG